jgi:phage-related tail protein
MSKRSFIENKNPGSLDFIENSLSENSKDLKELTDEMREITQHLKDITELKTAVNRLTESLNQSMPQKIAEAAKADPKMSPNAQEIAPIKANYVVKCTNWAEFETYAKGAPQVVFTIRESDKVFEADAVKGNQIIAYIGKIPEFSELLKVWLTTKLGSASTFEGTITKA